MELIIKNAIASVMSAAEKVGINPFELGCKYLLQQIDLVNTLIDTAKEKADDLYDVYMMTYKNDFDPDVVADIRKEFSAIRKTEVEAKEYRQALRHAIKEWKKSSTEAEKALMQARARVRAQRMANEKPLPEGARDFDVQEKISMKSYKIMKFNPIDLYGKTVRDAANKINRLLVKPKDETQDQFRERCNKIRAAFYALRDLAVGMLKEGKPYEVSADQAKINNARQSELTDAIQVQYGNTTEMMISVRHCIADLFDENVSKYLDKDHKKGMELVNEVQAYLACVFVLNGISVKLYGIRNKESRKLHYKFWTANNSQLKIGECYLLSDASFEIAKKAGMAGMTEEEFNKIKINGSDALKYWSYASTPGCPMVDDDGNLVTLDDVLVLKSRDIVRLFKNVLVVDEFGKYMLMSEYDVKRAFNDGGALMINIPSQQFRGAFCFKGFGVRIADKNGNMVDEIAAREGLTVPDLILDCDGKLQDWRKFKVITSEDTWKWKKYGLTFAEFKARMNALAKEIPGVNLMYTARLADSIEEDDHRKMARQTTQQWANAMAEQIAELVATDVNKLKKFTTLPGVIKKMAGLDKNEKDRTAYEHLIEACPEILAHPLMQEKVKEMFDAQFANAAMRPSVHGCYPYIAEDPVAVIKVWIFGMNQDQLDLGYLKENEINIPKCEEQKKLFFVRYPANHLVGMVRYNHNDPIYRYCGNVALLSIDGDTIVRADGDFDGDEASIVTDEIVVELCEQVSKWANRPLIVFPHQKAETKVVTGAKSRAMMIARSIVIANRFGGAVGQNSNLATKCIQAAAVATDLHERKNHLMNACWAHVGAILAIDLAKTGSMPSWLEEKLVPLQKAYTKMPWNQRFAKHTTTKPWWSKDWDVSTQAESCSTPDRIARAIMAKLGVEGEKYIPTAYDELGNVTDYEFVPAKLIDMRLGEDEFDIGTLLAHDVKNYDTKANVSATMFKAIEARNYREKTDNSDGDNEFKLVNDVRNGEEVGCAELFRFIWRNRAALVYKTSTAKITNDKIGNAEMVNGYYEFCHDVMTSICANSKSAAFTKLSMTDRMKALANKFIKLAFSEKNGIGKDIKITDDMSKEEKDRLERDLLVRHASFLDFTLKVFAYEAYQAVCANKGIKNVWVKPENAPVETSDDVPQNDGADSIF